MKNLNQNFRYLIILLIVLILGILIFGNYNLNLSLIEGIGVINSQQKKLAKQQYVIKTTGEFALDTAKEIFRENKPK
tara:strand:- start:172 stop:402 length:231 start_codon:yes stop_codon:yes gene_type:complete